MGSAAVEAIASGASGQMVGIVCDRMTLVPLADISSKRKELNLDLLQVARIVAG
jgi:6-phosphofructokinase